MANILNVGIGAQLGGLRSGLSQAEKELTSFSQGVEKRLGSISTERLERGLSNIGSASVPAASKLASSMGTVRRSTGNTTSAVINFNRVIQDAPFGIIGVANNIEPLITSFQHLQRTTGSTTGAFKTLLKSAFTGPGAIITITSAVSTALIAIQTGMIDVGDSTKVAKKAAENFLETLNSIIDTQNELKFDESLEGQEKAARNNLRLVEAQLAAYKDIAEVSNDVSLSNAISTGNLTQSVVAGINKLFGTSLRQTEELAFFTETVADLEEEREKLNAEILALEKAQASEAIQDEQTQNKILELEKKRREVNKEIAEARRAVTTDVDGDVVFEADIDVGNVDKIIDGFEKIGEAGKEAGEEASKGIQLISEGLGGVVGQLIRGQEEAFKFSNIMSAILPALAKVLFPGGGFFSGLARGLFGGIFHDGGVVPGPVGQERFILAEAGETVVPRGGSMGGKRVIQVPVYIDNRQVAFAQTSYDETVGR